AYVAFTRARRSLLLTGAWWRPERKKPVRPSRFLTALTGRGLISGTLEVEPQNAENPLNEVEETAVWPAPAATDQRQELLDAAQRVEAGLGADLDFKVP